MSKYVDARILIYSSSCVALQQVVIAVLLLLLTLPLLLLTPISQPLPLSTSPKPLKLLLPLPPTLPSNLLLFYTGGRLSCYALRLENSLFIWYQQYIFESSWSNLNKF